MVDMNFTQWLMFDVPETKTLALDQQCVSSGREEREEREERLISCSLSPRLLHKFPDVLTLHIMLAQR
jgi:hypothetical protein